VVSNWKLLASMINKKQYQNLEEARKRGKLSHAHLFVGPEKTGKFDVMMKLVSNFSKIDVKKLEDHPDFFLVRPEMEKKKKGKIFSHRKKDISVKQVKEKVRKLFLHPFELSFQVLVIEEAEKLTTVAVNSLLKLIEEPPENVLIFVLSHQELSLLPTIRSRCQIVRFGLVSREIILKELNGEFPGTAKKTLEECSGLSCGKIQLAREYLMDEEKMEREKELQEKFKKALRGGVLNGLELVEELGDDREELLSAMERWLWWLRGFLYKVVEDGESPKMVRKVSDILRRLMKTQEKIKQTHADHKLQLENFFVQLN